MGLVDRFERKLEDSVGNAFARVFGGSIVPQEVEAMLRSAGFEILGRPEAEVYVCRRGQPPYGPGAVYPAKGPRA